MSGNDKSQVVPLQGLYVVNQDKHAWQEQNVYCRQKGARDPKATDDLKRKEPSATELWLRVTQKKIWKMKLFYFPAGTMARKPISIAANRNQN